MIPKVILHPWSRIFELMKRPQESHYIFTDWTFFRRVLGNSSRNAITSLYAPIIRPICNCPNSIETYLSNKPVWSELSDDMSVSSSNLSSLESRSIWPCLSAQTHRDKSLLMNLLSMIKRSLYLPISYKPTAM